LSKLTGHPYIVGLITYFEDSDKGILYLVMELAEGGNLENWLKENKDNHQKEDEAINYFLQMVSVIKYLHSNLIAHRDLKPSNFVLRGGNLVLIDFGFSKESAQSIFEFS
jgi:NIMA (never in mitosis gene a)-related kinase 1/4/5